MAVCAWCGQGFSAPNFHAVGTWSIAVNGSCVFTTPSRTTGGRQRPAYVRFETRLGRLAGAAAAYPESLAGAAAAAYPERITQTTACSRALSGFKAASKNLHVRNYTD